MFNLSSISSLAFLDEPRLQVGTLRSRRLEVMGVRKKGACERDTRPCHSRPQSRLALLTVGD